MATSNQWNLLLSAFDPYMQEFLTKLASGIPANHPLRSKILGSIIGVANSWVESLSDKVDNQFLKSLVEKASDYSEAFSTALHGGKAGVSTTRVIEDWMGRFFDDAGERLKSAVSETAKTAMSQRIKAEFKLRCELFQVIEQARKEMEPNAPEEFKGVNWKEMEENVETLLRRLGKVSRLVNEKLKPFDEWLGKQRGVKNKGKLW
jgi:hypothetical protein